MRRRRFDIRRLPIELLFLASMAAVYLYLLRDYLWQFRDNAGTFLLRVLLLLPVVLFFAAVITVALWYVFRMCLPGLVRYRRLKLIRYERALRNRE